MVLHRQSTNVASLLEAALPQEMAMVLRTLGGMAAEPAYLVGGPVRDLLLGRRLVDLDVVVEGDAMALAGSLAQALGGRAVTHPRFGTAKLRLPFLTVDLATARAETYSRPGALPTVRPAPIAADLWRRDFSVNAMAVSLAPASFGCLLDPCGGRPDLERRLVRALHQRSFQDDATRILRAIRYEGRLAFRLEPATEGWLRRDVAFLDTISGDRLRRELELIFREETPEGMLARADEVGALGRIYPPLAGLGDGWLAARFQEARSRRVGQPLLYSCLLTYRLAKEEADGAIARLKLPGRTAQAVRHTQELRGILEGLAAPGLAPSAFCQRLEGSPLAAVASVAVASPLPLARRRLWSYLKTWRYVKPVLDGEALMALGVPPGPELGRLLLALRHARWDGLARTAEEERALVQRWLGQRPLSSP